MIHSVSGSTVGVVKKFHAGYGDTTPDRTSVSDIVSGKEQLACTSKTTVAPRLTPY